MKSFPLTFLLAAALGAPGSLVAQNAVTNGDFSSNGAAFSTFPGYLGGANPAAIDNWTGGPGGVGVNGVGIHAPFGPADQSAATNYGFLQGGGVNISQTITLLPDTTYDLSFLAASRNGNIDALGRVLLADNSTTYYDSTTTHWDTAAFQAVSDMFTTGASFDGPVVLTLSNDTPAGDNTVSYSDLVISAFNANDPDGDGIDTDDEISGVQNAFDGAPTDPNDPDSDGDGIDDKEEGQADGGADGFVTDPNNADTDGDGYEDAFEIAQGSDPTDAQSTPEVVVNGDFSSNASAFATFPGYLGGGNPGAIDGWTASPSPAGVNGVGISTPFGPADQSAATYYGFLQNGGANLTQTIPLQSGTTYALSFLAASRNGNLDALGRVLVADNSTTYYDSTVTHWDTATFQAVREMFTTGASIDGPVVLTLSNDTGAGDNTVSYSDLSITEFVASDPDGDGISTADETSGVQNAFDGAPTDPNNADSDGDGIDDKEEGQAGGGADGFVTDPNNADTDGDGYEDAFEVAQGFDPTDVQSSPTTLVDNSFIANGDFSANDEDFVVYPGYSPTPESWDEAGQIGVNGGESPHTPFADNGANDGAVAFLQGDSTLSQTIFGNAPGQTLYLIFDYNTRTFGSGSAMLEVFAGSLLDPLFSEVVDIPVGGDNPYYNSDLITFEAPPELVWDLRFTWTLIVAGDRTVLIDNVILSDVVPPQTPQWDTDQGTPDDQGGTGTWDTVTTNFWDGVANIAWPTVSSGEDEAEFGATPGTVTIAAGGITANRLNFLVDGYTVAGAPLLLDGASPILEVASGSTTSFSAKISAPDAAVTKSGRGTLLLQADATLDSLTLGPNGGTVNVAPGATLSNDANPAGDNFGIQLQQNTNLIINGTVNSTAGDFGGSTGHSGWTVALNPGGNLTVAGNTFVGWNANGTIYLDGGTSHFGGFLSHQDGGSGTIDVTAGTHTIAGNLGATCNGGGASTQIFISGGILSSGSVVFSVGETADAPLGVNDLLIILEGGVLETDRVALTRGPATEPGDTIFDFIFDGGTLRALPGGTSSTLIDGDLGMDTLGFVDLFVTIETGGAIIDTNGEDKSIDQILEGGGALTKQGAGTLLLTSDNSYGGGTIVTAGCLSLDHMNAIPSVTSVTVSAGASFGGIVGPGNLSDANIQNIVDNTNWDAGGGSFLVIDTNGADLTVTANITGDIGLIKKGAGELTLTGANTYTGSTVIAEGSINGVGGTALAIIDISRSGNGLVIEFTSAGNVDVYRSPNLELPATKVGDNVTSPFTDPNIIAADPENFYFLVPAGQAFP